MGLWREVYLQDSGAVAIRYPMVITHFPSASLEQANLTVETELHNASDFQITGVLDGRIGEIRFNQTYILKPHEIRTVRFTPEEFPQLQVKNPKVWWPYHMGDAESADSVAALCRRQRRIGPRRRSTSAFAKSPRN